MKMDEQSTLVIAKMIRDRIASKQWRSETEREVKSYARNKGADRAMQGRLAAEVRRQYEEAGAGYSGRFQG